MEHIYKGQGKLKLKEDGFAFLIPSEPYIREYTQD